MENFDLQLTVVNESQKRCSGCYSAQCREKGVILNLNEKAYFCTNKRIYFCLPCYKIYFNKSVEVNKSELDHHPLEILHERFWKCDHCHHHHIRKSNYYHCSYCHFKLCFRCFFYKKIQVTFPHIHDMNFASNNQSPYECDGAYHPEGCVTAGVGQAIDQTQKYFCNICKCKLCASCYRHYYALRNELVTKNDFKQIQRPDGWICCGKYYFNQGCLSNYNCYNKTLSAVRYRCEEANVDLCKQCYQEIFINSKRNSFPPRGIQPMKPGAEIVLPTYRCDFAEEINKIHREQSVKYRTAAPYHNNNFNHDNEDDHINKYMTTGPNFNHNHNGNNNKYMSMGPNNNNNFNHNNNNNKYMSTGTNDQESRQKWALANPENQYKSYEELILALRSSGLESSNLILGIDYTLSNKHTGTLSFGGQCLHTINSRDHTGRMIYNPYEMVITISGKVLSEFDDDNLIPVYGFGDATTTDRSVFPFWENERSGNGFEEVLSRYSEITPNVILSGPTNFAPIIYKAIDIVNKTQQYHILIIIADGEVDNVIESGKAVIEASNHPLSIVCIGVGDGPFDNLKDFDDGLEERKFDNVNLFY